MAVIYIICFYPSTFSLLLLRVYIYIYIRIPCPSSFCKPSRINERVLFLPHFTAAISVFPFHFHRYFVHYVSTLATGFEKKKLKVDTGWDNRGEYSCLLSLLLSSSFLFFLNWILNPILGDRVGVSSVNNCQLERNRVKKGEGGKRIKRIFPRWTT